MKIWPPYPGRPGVRLLFGNLSPSSGLTLVAAKLFAHLDLNGVLDMLRKSASAILATLLFAMAAPAFAPIFVNDGTVKPGLNAIQTAKSAGHWAAIPNDPKNVAVLRVLGWTAKGGVNVTDENDDTWMGNYSLAVVLKRSERFILPGTDVKLITTYGKKYYDADDLCPRRQSRGAAQVMMCLS